MINIGFMVCQPEFIDYIEGDNTVLEKSPLEKREPVCSIFPPAAAVCIRPWSMKTSLI